MENVKYNLKWNCRWNDQVRNEIDSLFEKISNQMFEQYSTSCVIAVIKDCDEYGAYNTMDIHVFANFIDANDLINKEMYATRHQLEVYHYDCIKNTFVRVMDKCYDSFDFGRPAMTKVHTMFDDQVIFRMRKVFDMKETNITLYNLEN